jgi:hypothetical protein
VEVEASPRPEFIAVLTFSRNDVRSNARSSYDLVGKMTSGGWRSCVAAVVAAAMQQVRTTQSGLVWSTETAAR